MTESAGGEYKVHVSQTISAKIKQLFRHIETNAPQFKEQFLRDLKQIHKRLKTDPKKWGDPIYTLKKLNMTVFHRALVLINVHYAVLDEKQLVFLKEIALLPGTLPKNEK